MTHQARILVIAIALASKVPIATAAEGSKVAEYKEVVRTYVDFSGTDLTACEESFRFINGNWMDCALPLPNPGIESPLKQIFPARFAVQTLSMPTPMPDISLVIDIRSVARDFDSAALGTRLWVTGYYVRTGDSRIQSLAPDYYGFSVLADYLKEGLKKLAEGRALTSRLFIAIDQDAPSSISEDLILGSVYLARRDIALSVAACRAAYRHEWEDDHGGAGAWYSGCDMTGGTARNFLPLSRHWSSELSEIASDTPIEVDQPDEQGSGSTVVHVYYGVSGSFGVLIGRRSLPNGPVDFDVDVPFERAERGIVAAFDRIKIVRPHFVLGESELGTMDSGEALVGKLVLIRSAQGHDVIGVSRTSPSRISRHCVGFECTP